MDKTVFFLLLFIVSYPILTAASSPASSPFSESDPTTNAPTAAAASGPASSQVSDSDPSSNAPPAAAASGPPSSTFSDPDPTSNAPTAAAASGPPSAFSDSYPTSDAPPAAPASGPPSSAFSDSDPTSNSPPAAAASGPDSSAFSDSDPTSNAPPPAAADQTPSPTASADQTPSCPDPASYPTAAVDQTLISGLGTSLLVRRHHHQSVDLRVDLEAQIVRAVQPRLVERFVVSVLSATANIACSGYAFCLEHHGERPSALLASIAAFFAICLSVAISLPHNPGRGAIGLAVSEVAVGALDLSVAYWQLGQLYAVLCYTFAIGVYLYHMYMLYLGMIRHRSH